MATPGTKPSRTPPIPPLRDGDRLTREEFERRYEAMPEVKKAELIEGVVYMPSPVRLVQHGQPHAHFVTWLGLYKFGTPGLLIGDNTTIRLDMQNEPQPDVCLMIEPDRDGAVQISADGYVVGAPELVAEVAASSVDVDLKAKLRAYQRNQVREYVVWRVEDQAIDWFVLRESSYAPLGLDEKGVYRSQVFPGLWLDSGAMVRSELMTVQQVLRQGIGSPEYAAFVERLQHASGH